MGTLLPALVLAVGLEVGVRAITAALPWVDQVSILENLRDLARRWELSKTVRISSTWLIATAGAFILFLIADRYL